MCITINCRIFSLFLQHCEQYAHNCKSILYFESFEKVRNILLFAGFIKVISQSISYNQTCYLELYYTQAETCTGPPGYRGIPGKFFMF